MNTRIPDDKRRLDHQLKRDQYLNLFISNIKKNKNFTFTKYGDGELTCMSGGEGKNCDGHPYSEELGSALKKSMLRNAVREDVFLGDWTGWDGDSLSKYRDELLGEEIKPNYVLYEVLLNHEFAPNSDLLQLHEAIKYSTARKIFVGPERLWEVSNVLNCYYHVRVPLVDSFSEYDRILNKCLTLMKPNDIFLFSCGLPSKILIDEMLEEEKDLTCLDFGSGFDNILLDEATRQGQVPPVLMKDFYKKLLT